MLGDNTVLVGSTVLAALLVVLLLVLDNLGGDVVPVQVLLAGALRGRGRREERHGCAASVGNQIRSRRDAGGSARAAAVVLTSVRGGVGLAIVALGGGEVAVAAAGA